MRVGNLSGELMSGADLVAARNPDELARFLHDLLVSYGVTATVLAVIEPDGALRMSGVAGEPM